MPDKLLLISPHNRYEYARSVQFMAFLAMLADVMNASRAPYESRYGVRLVPWLVQLIAAVAAASISRASSTTMACGLVIFWQDLTTSVLQVKHGLR